MSIFHLISTSTLNVFYLKHKVVFHDKYFMWFSKAMIHCAIRLMHVSQFAMCHLAPNICSSAPMFQAQEASTRCFSQSTRPRAMSPGNQALQLTHQYVMDKVMVEFPKFYGFSKHKLRHAFC